MLKNYENFYRRLINDDLGMDRQTLGEVVERVTDRNKRDVLEPVREACDVIGNLAREMFEKFMENVEAFEELKP